MSKVLIVSGDYRDYRFAQISGNPKNIIRLLEGNNGTLYLDKGDGSFANIYEGDSEVVAIFIDWQSFKKGLKSVAATVVSKLKDLHPEVPIIQLRD